MRRRLEAFSRIDLLAVVGAVLVRALTDGSVVQVNDGQMRQAFNRATNVHGTSALWLVIPK